MCCRCIPKKTKDKRQKKKFALINIMVCTLILNTGMRLPPVLIFHCDKAMNYFNKQSEKRTSTIIHINLHPAMTERQPQSSCPWKTPKHTHRRWWRYWDLIATDPCFLIFTYSVFAIFSFCLYFFALLKEKTQSFVWGRTVKATLTSAFRSNLGQRGGPAPFT